MCRQQSASLPPHPYLLQVGRACRFLERYRIASMSGPGISTPCSYEDIEDLLWAFFQNCWHVKDWLRNDPTVDEAIRLSVKAAAESDPVLQVVRALANGTKHLVAYTGRDQPSADDTGIQFTHNSDGTISTDHLIDIARPIDPGLSERITALALGEKAMTRWQEILIGAGRPYPSRRA